MRIGPLIVLLALVAPTVQTQSHPDFTGSWVLVSTRVYRSVRDPAIVSAQPAFSDRFTATQDAVALTIDRLIVRPAGRGMASQTVTEPLRQIFKFDGSDTNVTTIGYSTGQPPTRIASRTQWDGAKLTISRVWSGDRAAATSQWQILWIAADGTLVVETTTNPEPLASSHDRPVITRDVYKRAS